MKRILAVLLTASLLLGLLVTGVPVGAATEANPLVVNLMAGQNDDAGDVLVWNDGTTLFVEYQTSGDWIITETHLYAGKNVSPTTAPGQFPYTDSNAVMVSDTVVRYEIALSAISNYEMKTNKKDKATGPMIATGDPGVGPGCGIYLATHAVVMRPLADCWETVWQIGDVEVVDATTGWLNNYADEFNWMNATATTAGDTLAVSTPAFADPFVVGTTPTNEFPYNSNFSRGYATDFNVQWDGTLPFGGQLTISWSPGSSASETKIIGDGIVEASFSAIGTTETGEGWFLNKYPLVENTFAMSPVVSGTHTINLQHTQGDGTFWDWILLEKPCVQEESAWGEGEDFDQSNWAMYFLYGVTGELWQIGTPNGAVNPIAGSAEYPVNGAWDEEYDYVVGVDTDPIGAPSIPGYIGSQNVAGIANDGRPATWTTQRLNIQFDLCDAFQAGELVLIYDRYGSETDNVYFDFDGTPFAIVAATEGGFQHFELALPATTAGTHTITIAYEGGGDANGHYIDYLKLIAP
ncbi:MAG: hypothetical protein ACRKGH_09010 [Dehalogenimonas sp.]